MRTTRSATTVGFPRASSVVPAGPDVRARGRRPGDGVGGDRPARAVRGADLRVVPDARASTRRRRARHDRRRPAQERRLQGRVDARRGACELANELGDSARSLFHPLVGGIPPDLAWESLELFEAKVLPRLRP